MAAINWTSRVETTDCFGLKRDVVLTMEDTELEGPVRGRGLLEAGAADAAWRCLGKSVGWRAMPPAFGLNLKRYGASRPVTTGQFRPPHRTARAVPLEVGGLE